MSNVTTSPNMNLPVPNVALDPGPDWANNINACLSILDQHNHSSGSGVQINPAGININSDLPFNNNNLTLARSIRFNPQLAPLSGAADLGCLYETGVDLYYNDGSGNQIRITQGGSVTGSAGTITGLPSGTASASYGAGTFVFQSATSTPANIDGASIVLRNNVANSKGLTLAPPNSMAANYSLTLPLIPVAESVLAVDTSGNIVTNFLVPGTQIAAQTIAQGNLALRSTGTTVGAGGVAVSASCGLFTTNTNSYVQITNFSVTITTTGRPVMLMTMSDGTGTAPANMSTDSTEGFIKFTRASTDIGFYGLLNPSNGQIPNNLQMLDFPTAGTYTYTVSAKSNASSTVEVVNSVLVAYEI